jgi:DNA-binding transcriptional regulator YiaG
MPEPSSTLPDAKPGAKPFPWRCHRCRKKEVRPAVSAYRSPILYEGQQYPLDTPELVVPRCAACGEFVFTDQVEQQVDRVFRTQLHLLTAEQIQTNRRALELSRQELAARLGVEEDLLRRWEDNLLVPSRAHDNLLRLYFGLP